MQCEEEIVRIGGTWADSRKPNRCPNRARFIYHRKNNRGELLLCGIHVNTRRRWAAKANVPLGGTIEELTR